MRRALLALLLAASPASARQTVVSPAAEAVSVTVYRDPGRSAEDEMDGEWLKGFALITESRTVELPAGDSEIRFEGVAGGIIPASAIVAGLPGGAGEKNRDARLLSPGALVDAALGRRVHIRRTSRATGKVTETEAIIRSGPDGVVIQTAEGIEALRCSGLPETLIYNELPPGLSDRPTLAVTSNRAAPVRATVRLSYLATGFDWQASYVVGIQPGGRTLDLFAWLTLANSNDESFVGAQAQAVAGSLNREEDDEGDFGAAQPSAEISLQCWPRGTTSDLPLQVPAPQEALEEYQMDGESIVVTGSRINRKEMMSVMPLTVMTAEQEDLGDLKLYRIPEPVTVAAHAQKQVALLSRTKVPFKWLYGASVSARDEMDEPQPANLLLRMKNVPAEGLGLPLPAGRAVVFEQTEGRQMMLGEGGFGDSAVGQDVELLVGESAEVQIVQRRLPRSKSKAKKSSAASEEEDEDEYHSEGRRGYEIEVSNAKPQPVEVEIVLRVYEGEKLRRPSRRLGLKEGRRFWRTTVPAGSRARLSYQLEVIPPKPRESEENEDEDESPEG